MTFFFLFFSCSPKTTNIVPEPVVSDAPIARTRTYELPETQKLPDNLRTQWPPVEWSSAKAYSFNQKDFGPQSNLYAFKDGVWNESITQEHALSPQQAQKSIELNHRIGGTLIVSKCAFPRHAVVFFDAQNQPVASINVCFSCGDILIWPPYTEDLDWNTKRFSIQGEEDMPMIFSAHEEILPLWDTLLLKESNLPTYMPAEE